jgi:hypothetical protein
MDMKTFLTYKFETGFEKITFETFLKTKKKILLESLGTQPLRNLTPSYLTYWKPIGTSTPTNSPSTL